MSSKYFPIYILKRTFSYGERPFCLITGPIWWPRRRSHRECISSVVFPAATIAWRPKKTTLEMYSLAAAYSRKKHFSIDFFGPRRCTGGSWARRFASVSVKWTFPMWECWHFEPLLSEDIFVTNVKATDLESTWKTHQVLLQLCHENVIWEKRFRVSTFSWECPFQNVKAIDLESR